jgi:hypothetical protein
MNSWRSAFPNPAERLITCWRFTSISRVPKRQLREVGWTKARELVKVARRDGAEFDCAPWVHKAKELPKEEFKREVDRYLTGKDTEAWEIIYFRLYKSQLSAVERALEIAALMLGSDKSRGYSLEMICADFLAGATLEVDNSIPVHESSASVAPSAATHGPSDPTEKAT